MKNREIAIIGVSGLFPGAKNMNEFYDNLKNGVDSISEMPEERLRSSCIDPDKDYMLCGYLDRVDFFDHPFFNISLGEAEIIDPIQRYALQMSVKAIENAGYSLDDFRGTKTAVIFSANRNDYVKVLQHDNDLSGAMLVGDKTGAISAKVCYYLDLHGPALMVDTTCSSSLVSIHEACMKILTGEVDYALSGGFQIGIDFPDKDLVKLDPYGIAAPNGRSKAFDASADGTGGGEGIGVVLLKLLDKAIEDGDHIHAVIKSTAINHDGSRANGFGAPSSVAHQEVIVNSWKKAGIDPETVTNIEAHGTGTKLGDPIEIKAFSDAFNEFTDKKQFCSIGSLKTNIGHLGAAAGVAGLLKLVLSLRYKQVFPSLFYKTPNPHIDFDNSAVTVNTRLTDWNPPALPRRGGISSLGLTGTNAHALLEESPGPVDQYRDNYSRYLITLSAKDGEVLAEYKKDMLAFINESGDALLNISYVLNKGRDDYPVREALVVTNKEELRDALRQSIDQATTVNTQAHMDENEEKVNVVFFCSGATPPDQEELDFLQANFAAFEACLQSPEIRAAAEGASPEVSKFLYDYCLYRTLQETGIKAAHVIGSGLGNITVSVITGKISFEEGLEQARNYKEPAAPFNKDKFQSFIKGLCSGKRNLILELGGNGKLSDAFRELLEQEEPGKESSLFYSYNEDLNRGLNSFYRAFYLAGGTINWAGYYGKRKIYRVEAPTYPFRKIRCWIVPENTQFKGNTTITALEMTKNISQKQSNEPLPDCTLNYENPGETEKTAARIWAKILKIESVGKDDDFFMLGGDSLMGTQLQKTVKDHLGIELGFDDIYKNSLFSEFAALLEGSTGTGTAADDNKIVIQPMGKDERVKLSFNQESMYHIYKLNPDSPFYNMQRAVVFDGKLNIDALEKTLAQIIERHKILRTVYRTEEGHLYQSVLTDYEYTLPIVDLSDEPEQDVDQLVEDMFVAESRIPFNLEQDPSIRTKLVKINSEKNFLFVVLHHIATDAWGCAILIDEIRQIYPAFNEQKSCPLPMPAIQYIDYSHWQREHYEETLIENQISYWKKTLTDAQLLHTLPLDRKRPDVQAFRGTRAIIKVEDELRDNLKKLSGSNNVTLFALLLGSFNLLVSRLSDSNDIVVGVPVANRHIPGIENLIGYFVNTLPIRTRIDETMSFNEYLKMENQILIDSFNNQDIPFDKIVEVINPPRSSSYQPLFQLMFLFQNVPGEELELPGVKVSQLSPKLNQGTSRNDITIAFVEQYDHLQAVVEYDIDLFDEETIENMIDKYKILLTNIVRKPEAALRDIPIMSDEEREKVLSGLNSGEESDDDYDF